MIRQAQRLSLEGMAAGIADVAERARAGRLDPDDVHGGTFTITNPGQFGAVLATPIINQPQVGILDLEAIVKRPVVVERDGQDAIAIRPMTYLCMSWDHRALDGAVAARFLAGIKDSLEKWSDSNERDSSSDDERRAEQRARGARSRGAAGEARLAHGRVRDRCGSLDAARAGPGRRAFVALPDARDAIADALRLSEAMTYKAAAAGLDLGGGKAVLSVEREPSPRSAAR